MQCTSCRLIQFRNFIDKSIFPDKNLTILTGVNGAGKTNVLEAIYMASIGRSFRTHQEMELIGFPFDECTILLYFIVRDMEHEIKVKLSKNKGKKLFLNDNQVSRKELLGLFRSVLFTPDEMKLIKGVPKDRRRFIDMELSQINPRYYEELSRYNRAVSQRNAAFRNAKYTGKMPDVDMWDMQIALGASYLVKKRLEAIRKMNKTVLQMQSILTNDKEELQIVYKQFASEKIETDVDWYIHKLVQNREEDFRLGHTSIGPHRDDLIFFLNGKNIDSFGSQGQQRTAILAMKLAEIQFIKEETGAYPILLLDDVTGELDEQRRQALFGYIKEHHVQTIMTTAVLPTVDYGVTYTIEKRGIGGSDVLSK